MNLSQIGKKAIKEAGNFFFPNLCLCCQEIVSSSEKLLCQKCIHHLFQTLPTFSLKGCFHYTEIIVTLDNPFFSTLLLKQAKQQPKLYRVLASFMVLQLQKIDSLNFDIVMPVYAKKRFFPHQPSFLLAKNLAEMFDVPYTDIGDKDPIKNKIILIVDEKLNMDRLEIFGKKLAERNPKMLFAVTFTR